MRIRITNVRRTAHTMHQLIVKERKKNDNHTLAYQFNSIERANQRTKQKMRASQLEGNYTKLELGGGSEAVIRIRKLTGARRGKQQLSFDGVINYENAAFRRDGIVLLYIRYSSVCSCPSFLCPN